MRDLTTAAAASRLQRDIQSGSILARKWISEHRDDLTPRARKVAYVLAQHASVREKRHRTRHLQPGEVACWPSMRVVARKLRVSRRTVLRAIQDLESAGLTKVRSRFTNAYVFGSVTPVGTLVNPYKNSQGPCSRSRTSRSGISVGTVFMQMMERARQRRIATMEAEQ